MAKAYQDVPVEMKQMVKTFEEAAYRHDYSRLFEDWLTCLVCCFAFKTMEEEYLAVIKRYNQKDIELLTRLTGEYIALHYEKTCSEIHYKDPEKKKVPWYDGLGSFYEAISSYGKKSGLGQYFTPDAIVEFMVQILDPQGSERQIEPACGSGRFIIASHCHNPGPGIRIGVDVDPICVKMTAVNMFLHGCKGEVICGNGLDMTDFRFGYVINPNMITPGIYKLEKENSFYHNYGLRDYAERVQQKAELQKKVGLENSLFKDGIDTQMADTAKKQKKVIEKVSPLPIIQQTLF